MSGDETGGGGPSAYLRSIRRLVGTKLLLLPSAVILIWDDADRLLLVKQAEFDCWGTVGGMIEPGETPEEAACREALEETGCVVSINRLRAAVGGLNYQVVYPNGDEVAYVGLVFDARILAGTPTPDNFEISEIGWFSQHELVDVDLHDFTREMFTEIGLIQTT